MKFGLFARRRMPLCITMIMYIQIESTRFAMQYVKESLIKPSTYPDQRL